MPKKNDENVELDNQLETEAEISSEPSIDNVNDELAETVETPARNITEPVFENVESENAIESETPEISEEGGTPVTVQSVKFASFEDLGQAQGEINKNLDILMDIKLQMTVELGRTELPIKKVLELTRGSIIELEKVAGEPVELFANGKLVAHGEVVVIEDNFGLRITSITDPEDRLKGLD